MNIFFPPWVILDLNSGRDRETNEKDRLFKIPFGAKRTCDTFFRTLALRLIAIVLPSDLLTISIATSTVESLKVSFFQPYLVYFSASRNGSKISR